MFCETSNSLNIVVVALLAVKYSPLSINGCHVIVLKQNNLFLKATYVHGTDLDLLM